jgi:hypothetical protein
VLLSARRRPSASRAVAAMRSISFLLVAALRHGERDLVAAQRQRLGDQRLLDQLVAQQHQGGFGRLS